MLFLLKCNLLLLLIFVASLVIATQKHAFDLNKTPPEERDDDEAKPAFPPSGQSRPQVEQPGKFTRERLKQLQAVYKKVEKLFETLRICNVENFDIEKIEIPKSWTRQANAMTVLNKVARHNMIKKSDLALFKRIMDNCNVLDKRIKEIEEERLGIMSQMSGMNCSDAEKFKKLLKDSPLEDLKSRSNKIASRVNAYESEQQPLHLWPK